MVCATGTASEPKRSKRNFSRDIYHFGELSPALVSHLKKHCLFELEPIGSLAEPAEPVAHENSATSKLTRLTQAGSAGSFRHGGLRKLEAYATTCEPRARPSVRRLRRVESQDRTVAIVRARVRF